MRRYVSTVLSLLLIVAALAGCGRPAASPEDSTIPTTPASTDSAATPASAPTPSAGVQAPQPSPAGPGFSNDLFNQSVMELDAYRRKVYNLSVPPPTTGNPIDSYQETAFIKDFFAMHGLLESAAWGSYSETVIIGDKMWERQEKDGLWAEASEKLTPENKPEFSYEVNPLHFPTNFSIRYEKLALTAQGNEQVNGYACVKYAVSGSYGEELTLYAGTENEAIKPIALWAAGEVWVLDDPAYGPILIRQRLNVDWDYVDIAGLDAPPQSATHVTIYDDLMDIDQLGLWEPTGSENLSTGPVEIPPLPQQVTAKPVQTAGFILAQDRIPGPFTQEDAALWTQNSWMSDYGGLLFEWINGYIVAFYCNGENGKLPENLYDQNVITDVEGRTYKGDLVYGGRIGQFAFTLNETGDAFEGTWKYADQQEYTDWNGQAVGAGAG